MTSNRMVVEVITRLLERVDTLEGKQNQFDGSLGEVDKQVKRLAKELYKSNIMNESAATEDIQQLFERLRADYDQQQTEAISAARLEIVAAFLPVIDAVEAGLHSGVGQLKRLRQTSPAAAQILYAWLNGQRLLRERLLKLLEAEEVYPLPALGQTFDPYRHIAVKVVALTDKPTDVVVKIERSGYVHGEAVLRFADVVVNKLS